MQSQQLNFIRWDILNDSIHENPMIYGSYEAEVENVRNYVKNRLAWMDKKLGYPKVPSNLSDAKTIESVSFWTTDNGVYIEDIPYPVTIDVVDIAGKLIANRTVSENNAFFALPKGMYVVRLHSSQVGIKTSKCIIP
jgi:hypothetical protein